MPQMSVSAASATYAPRLDCAANAVTCALEEERLDRRCDRLGPIEMQHVAGLLDRDQSAVGHERETRAHAGETVGRSLPFGMTPEPSWNERLVGRDPQHRRADAFPDREDLFHAIDDRKRQLVARIGGEPRAAVGPLLGPVRGEEL